MPYIENNGARLFWQFESEGDAPPMLMIMGLSFTLEMWFRVLPALVGSFRIVTFDNRGIGRSTVPPGPYSIGQMAEDAAAVMDAAGFQSAHIVGASMGGMIAQEFALRYPRRVRSLTLGCTTYSGLFGKWPRFGKGPGLSWFRMPNRLERERSMRDLLYAKATAEVLIEEDIHKRLDCTWTMKGVLSQLAAILLWNSYSRLPSIQAPTLVLHGEEDHLLPPENGQILASRIPNAVLRLIPDAGHILTTDQPEATVRHLLEFLHAQVPEWHTQS